MYQNLGDAAKAVLRGKFIMSKAITLIAGGILSDQQGPSSTAGGILATSLTSLLVQWVTGLYPGSSNSTWPLPSPQVPQDSKQRPRNLTTGSRIRRTRKPSRAHLLLPAVSKTPRGPPSQRGGWAGRSQQTGRQTGRCSCPHTPAARPATCGDTQADGHQPKSACRDSGSSLQQGHLANWNNSWDRPSLPCS